MLDKIVAPFVKTATDPIVSIIEKNEIDPRHLIYGVFGLSILCFLTIVSNLYMIALLLIAGNRLLSTATFRYQEIIEVEGNNFDAFEKFLFRLSNVFFYSGSMFFFTVSDFSNAMPGLFMIFGYMLNEFASIAYQQYERENNAASAEGSNPVTKTLFGLVTNSTLLIFFVLMCLIPVAFPLFAVALGFLGFASAFGRVMEVRLMQGSESSIQPDPLEVKVEKNTAAPEYVPNDHKDKEEE